MEHVETITEKKQKSGNGNDREVVIRASHVYKSFGDNEVLKDASFSLYRGETLAIMGKSGSGKSVLAKCLVGLITPDSGTFSLFDTDTADLGEEEWNKLRKKIGFLFQGGALYDSMSVRENLEFSLRRQRKEKGAEEIEEMVIDALENVGLSEAIDKMPSELSGGMQKRIGLARTIILKPEVIIYDEPTTGLDPQTGKDISLLITQMQRKFNISSLIITHDISCVKITANRILMLREGAFKHEGTYEELSQSDEQWVRSFFELE